MASNERSVTFARVSAERAYAEEQVRSQSALIGERAVAITRLVMMLLIGVCTNLVDRVAGEMTVDSELRTAAVAGYVVFSLAALISTHRVKRARPMLSIYLAGSFIFIDAAFFLFNAWLNKALGQPPRAEISAAVFAMLICFSVARSRLGHVILSTVISIACVIIISTFEGWFHPVWTLFVCSCLLALGLLIGFTNRRLGAMFSEVRRRENLSRFLPRQIVDRVLEQGGSSLEPVQREVTILFSDIRDFTTMSEQLAPREVMEFLDDYFGHMGQIVRGHEGMLNKFLGDGILAVWGVPDRQTDHAERAVRAAIDMRKKLVEINEHRVRDGYPEIRVGIGVHTGVVAAGMLGGADQREYAIIGDAVNLASRIEGLTKTTGTDLLISETAYRSVEQKFPGTRVSEEKVKGREEPVVIYSLA